MTAFQLAAFGTPGAIAILAIVIYFIAIRADDAERKAANQLKLLAQRRRATGL
jgi:hypothetical protein